MAGRPYAYALANDRAGGQLETLLVTWHDAGRSNPEIREALRGFGVLVSTETVRRWVNYARAVRLERAEAGGLS